jgi:hypothetical protein
MLLAKDGNIGLELNGEGYVGLVFDQKRHELF